MFWACNGISFLSSAESYSVEWIGWILFIQRGTCGFSHVLGLVNGAVLKIPGQILYGLFFLDEEMTVWMPGTADTGPRRPPGAGGRGG